MKENEAMKISIFEASQTSDIKSSLKEKENNFDSD